MTMTREDCLKVIKDNPSEWVGLKHKTAHIGPGCQVGDNVIIGPQTIITGECQIKDEAVLWGARVHGSVEVYGKAIVLGNIEGNCRVSGFSFIDEKVRVIDDVVIYGSPRLLGRCHLKHDVVVTDHCVISKDARIEGKCRLHGYCHITDDVLLAGMVSVDGRLSLVGADSFIGSMKLMSESPYTIKKNLMYCGTVHKAYHAGEGIIAIGCERHHYSHWLKHYRSIGRKNAYTPEQIKEYYTIIKLMASKIPEVGRD